jgi:hypothetical protein
LFQERGRPGIRGGTGNDLLQRAAAAAVALAATLAPYAIQLAEENGKGCLTESASAPDVIKYGDLDFVGGMVRNGRATGVVACLGTSALTENVDPVTGNIKRGYLPDIPGNRKGMDKTHLLGLELGGNNSRENLVPMWAKANEGWDSQQMRNIEVRQVAAALKAGYRVYFVVTPNYKGSPDPAVPVGLDVTWVSSGGGGDHIVVPNTNDPTFPGIQGP